MLTSAFLAWALIVQVQLQLCQDGVCTPHPKVQERSKVVQTLPSESECLLLQMDLQRAYQRMPRRSSPTGPSRRFVEATTTFTCQPSH
jgi:hypothetical protein